MQSPRTLADWLHSVVALHYCSRFFPVYSYCLKISQVLVFELQVNGSPWGPFQDVKPFKCRVIGTLIRKGYFLDTLSTELLFCSYLQF